MNYENLMTNAIALANQAFSNEEVPVGALIVDESGKILGEGFNQREKLKDPLSHAELNAISDARKKLNDWRFDELTIFVTLEPCAMCAGAIIQSRFKRLIFGAWDEKAGAVGSVWDLVRDSRALSKIEVISGVKEKDCSRLLQEFFKQFRN